MKRWIFLVAVLTAVSVGAWSVYAQQTTQEQKGAARPQQEQAVYRCPMHSEVQATWPTKCPKCGMTLQETSGRQGMMGMHGAKGAEQMQGMMARCRMLMQARIGKTTPAALLSIREKLNLTDQQVSKLESIAQESRQKAEATLTDEQRKTLATIPGEPQSMMAMCAGMMSMTGADMGSMHGMMGGGMGGMHGMMGMGRQSVEQQPSAGGQGRQARHDR